MSKTYHRIIKDDSEREQEAPAHKKRREIRKQLELFTDYDEVGEYTELDDVEIDTYEPIRRRKSN